MPAVLNYAGKLPRPDDPAIYEPIIDAIAIGHPFVSAASLAGIDVSTLHKWRHKGEAELEALKGEWKRWEELSPHCQLVIRIKSAQADMIDEALKNWRDGAKNWPAWATLLERRVPESFGRNERLDITETRTENYRIELGSATIAILSRALAIEKAKVQGIPLLTDGQKTIEPTNYERVDDLTGLLEQTD